MIALVNFYNQIKFLVLVVSSFIKQDPGLICRTALLIHKGSEFYAENNT
jgi:hypothetical protein